MTGGTDVLALVPVRGLRDGKTRLAGNLAPEARAALTGRMLRGVVRAALDSGVVAAVGVISPEPAALALAGEMSPSVVPLRQDAAAPGLNAAIDAGRAWAIGRGAAALLVLFADLPLLSGGNVRALVAPEAPLVLARDRHGLGTNGMLLRLDERSTGFRFQFGAGSYGRHLAEAERLGLGVAIADAAGTAVDLDTPEDLRLVLGRRDDEHALVGAPSLLADGAGMAEGGRP